MNLATREGFDACHIILLFCIPTQLSRFCTQRLKGRCTTEIYVGIPFVLNNVFTLACLHYFNIAGSYPKPHHVGMSRTDK